MSHNYDFFIAGKWRNASAITPVVELLRSKGLSVYCFLENDYSGETVEFRINDDPEISMKNFEQLSQSHPLVRKIFETDIVAERQAEHFLLVLPAGISGHIEAGIAYGMGKKCFALGLPEKTESLYCIFDQVFPNLSSLNDWIGNK